MAENRREKENRYYFSRGQMIILGGAFTLASVVVFLIGMLVGKELEERKILKKEEPLVKIPVKPTAPGSGGTPVSKNDEITFYDTLSKTPAIQAPSQQKPKEGGTAENSSKAEVKEAALPPKTESPSAKVAEKKIDKIAPPAEEPKRGATADSAEPKDSSKAWRAQVDAFPDERSAKRLVDRLKIKGYNNAYVTEAPFKGKTWYRVNVGKYASREEAEKIVETLKNKENQAKAFAASR